MENPQHWNYCEKILNRFFREDLTALEIVSILDHHRLIKNWHPDLEITIEKALQERKEDQLLPSIDQSICFQSPGMWIYNHIKKLGDVID